MKSNKHLMKRFNKIRHIISLDKLLHKEYYYFENGKMLDKFKVKKEGIEYSVLKIKPDKSKNKYLVYVNIYINNKIVEQQLLKTFDNIDSMIDYYENISIYINCTSNEEIIERCYNELPSFPRKNILTYIL